MLMLELKHQSALTYPGKTNALLGCIHFMPNYSVALALQELLTTLK